MNPPSPRSLEVSVFEADSFKDIHSIYHTPSGSLQCAKGEVLSVVTLPICSYPIAQDDDPGPGRGSINLDRESSLTRQVPDQ